MADNQELFLSRLRKAQNNFLASGIDAVFLTYSRTLLYYAGTTQPSALLVLPDDYFLLVFRGLDLVLQETWLNTTKIHSIGSYEDSQEILKSYSPKKGILGMELDVVPALQYIKYRRLFQHCEIVDISPLILKQRQIKDAYEVACTRHACKILDRGHERLVGVLKEGMTELELSAEIEDAHRKAGHEGLYFMRPYDFFMGRGPLATGSNLSQIAGKLQSISGVGLSASIPMGASEKIIKRGEMIVVDIPTHYRGYHGDQSRTYVLGAPSPTCKIMYSLMKEIADRLLENLTPGIRCDELYRLAVSFSELLGTGPSFMRIGSELNKVPFIGHGVGLELNEPPLIGKGNQASIEENMIITLELEMSGASGRVVKLEDTILVASNGPELLTTSPRGLNQL